MATTLSWNKTIPERRPGSYILPPLDVQNDTSSQKILELDESRVKTAFCLIDGALDTALEKVEGGVVRFPNAANNEAIRSC
jgi:hypothetical protein